MWQATTSTPTRPNPQGRPYQARGAAAELWRSRAPELLLSGPAGTGKSRACLEKIHWCAAKYPGMRALLIRKTRESISESTLVTWEDRVIPAGSPLLEGPRRNFRQSYRYPNGSQVVVGGMDKPSKIMSTEYDMVYVAEATELDEADWLALLTRLRNGKMPYQQIIADCNPDTPAHWIYRRCQDGLTQLLESRHEDNPVIFRNGDWTARGRQYIATLDRLTGAEKDRLRYGLWVQATGLILDQFSAENVTEAADYEADDDGQPTGRVLWALDDGYAGQVLPDGTFSPDSHPRAILLCQLRPDGRLCVFAESYRVKALSDQHIADVLALDYPAPDWVAHGPGAAEIRGRLHAAGLAARNAQHPVEDGLKNLNRWLGADANGWRRVLIHPRCVHLRRELVSYRRDASGGIVKEHDHGVDSLRYICWSLRHD